MTDVTPMERLTASTEQSFPITVKPITSSLATINYTIHTKTSLPLVVYDTLTLTSSKSVVSAMSFPSPTPTTVSFSHCDQQH